MFKLTTLIITWMYIFNCSIATHYTLHWHTGKILKPKTKTISVSLIYFSRMPQRKMSALQNENKTWGRIKWVLGKTSFDGRTIT